MTRRKQGRETLLNTELHRVMQMTRRGTQAETHHKYTQGNEGMTHRRGAQLNLIRHNETQTFKVKQETQTVLQHKLGDTNRAQREDTGRADKH